MKKLMHKNLLIAGQTGSGKSNFMDKMITTYLEENSPADLRLILIDPKRVQYAPYNGLPHLLSEVIYDSKKAQSAFRWAWGESNRRLKIIEEHRSSSIYDFNKNKFVKSSLPEIVIVIDEFADLVVFDSEFFGEYIEKITALSKITGIYVILSTAKVIPDVITERIASCFADRICFRATYDGASELVLGEKGAEKLKDAGSCIVKNLFDFKTKTQQMPYISDEDVVEKVKFLKEKYWDFNFKEVPEDDSDELYPQAKKIVIETGKASASLLQRKLLVGYSRASRLIDMLEENGVIGEANGAMPREILTEK